MWRLKPTVRGRIDLGGKNLTILSDFPGGRGGELLETHRAVLLEKKKKKGHTFGAEVAECFGGEEKRGVFATSRTERKEKRKAEEEELD